MQSALICLLVFLALTGHVALWVGLVNRIHGRHGPRWAIQAMTAACLMALILIPAATAKALRTTTIQKTDSTKINSGRGLQANGGLADCSWLAKTYWLSSAVLALTAVIIKARRSLTDPARERVLSSRIIEFRLGQRPPARQGGDYDYEQEHEQEQEQEQEQEHDSGHGHWLRGRTGRNRWIRWAVRLPGNEVLRVHVVRRTIRLGRLDRRLDGLKIAHLSDLHMSGRIGCGFFTEVARIVNSQAPDAIAITGDLFDAPQCLDWTEQTLGQLRARHGVYFILGNHDLKIDMDDARRRLTAAGLTDLGGRWQQREIRGAPVLLAGNELPWIAPAADVRQVDGKEHALRLLLAHTPDQFEWARCFNFDLMLAGHTHGGQIRLPLIGAIVSPTRSGTRYDAGVFFRDPTLLYVSRGVSSLTPLRWNCPPELSILTLECGQKPAREAPISDHLYSGRSCKAP